MGRLFLFICLLGHSSLVAKSLRIIHLNDLQSGLLGSGPQSEYSPDSVNDDSTIGGVARMATEINRLKGEAKGAVVVLDGGDFAMGSLFHTITRKYAPELRVLKALGVDATTLGNHEFDFGLPGLAQMIRSAGTRPYILAANIQTTPSKPEDDGIEALISEGRIQPYVVLEREGLRIGVFGLLGWNANEVSSFFAPLVFLDPHEQARQYVRVLREEKKVDVVIALTHAGVREDKALAKTVSGIDVIVGGHSHTFLPEPIEAAHGTLIVQAGSHGRAVGSLDLHWDSDGKRTSNTYQQTLLDDAIEGQPSITAMVDRFKEVVDQQFLSAFGLKFNQIVAQTQFELVRGRFEESGLGNLVSDALRWYLHEIGQPVDFCITSNGLIRDSLFLGKSGKQQVSDLFRLVPLGIGITDGSIGESLVRLYFSADDIWAMLEVPATLGALNGQYYLNVSGLSYEFGKYRFPFERVSDVQVVDSPGEPPSQLDPDRLYAVGMSHFMARKIHLVKQKSLGVLNVVPKNKDGVEIANIDEQLIDADPKQSGIQEVKEWRALVEYLRQFPKAANGISQIPTRYQLSDASVSLRAIQNTSLAPWYLYSHSRFLWLATALVLALGLLTFWLWRRLRRR